MTPFRLTPFRRLLLVQVPADLADWLDMVAIGALLAFEWRAPPVAFAWLAVAMALPPLTLGLPLGVLVDRWPLRRTLVLANLGRGLGTAALALAPGWEALMVVVALRAAADAAFGPARQAALQALVPEAGLVAANAQSQGINQATKVVAPAIGAALLVVLAPRGVFLANALLSALAALLSLTLPALRGGAAAPERMLAGLAAGVALVRRVPLLRAGLGLAAASSCAIFTYDTQIAPLVRDLGQGPSTLGLVLAAFGAGGLAGSFGVAALGRIAPLPLVAGAHLPAGLGIGAMGVAAMIGHRPSLPALLALCALVGVASSAARVPLRALIQGATPPGMMGRVAALAEAAAVGPLLLAPFLGAALAARAGSGAAFVAGAVLMLAVAALALHVSRRQDPRAGPRG